MISYKIGEIVKIYPSDIEIMANFHYHLHLGGYTWLESKVSELKVIKF